jgi:hypothetical protein|tara:strand:- start:8647 stop:8829 length:183 start_codon:yes stop_codon:yes gene_type:complete
MNNIDKKEKELNSKLNQFLNNNGDCQDEECDIKDPQELVQRENKKIITNDGRQLLSEYTS